jgi:hypothetical protein
VGEFDLFSLTDLRKTLNGILALCKRTLIDLSGITFLDLDFARGLALRLQLYATISPCTTLPQVTASVRVFGLWGWARFHPGANRDEPPVVSEASR